MVHSKTKSLQGPTISGLKLMREAKPQHLRIAFAKIQVSKCGLQAKGVESGKNYQWKQVSVGLEFPKRA